MTYLTSKEIRLIRLKEVLSKTGLSKSSLYNAIAQGEFPDSCLISARAVAWDCRAVDAWIESRLSGEVAA